jgi:signal transduction histidine kinase
VEESFLAGHPRVDALAELVAPRLLNSERASLIRELVRSATVDRKQRGGRVALKNGRHFEFAAVPLPDGNALFTMLDITDSRQVENVLRERAAALEESDRIKSAFVANMSYELRTPLTSIQGFAEMLQSGLAGNLSPQAGEYLVAILDSTARLGTLIDNVLDLTQSDAGALPIERKRIDLAALLRAAAAARAASAQEKAIDLAVEVDASVGSIKGDRKRILQAVDQLLLNAISYTETGGRVLLHGSGTTELATLIVSDNGPGMDETEQARALDRFSRVGAGIGREGDGSLGIGLPLARQFVEGHGGTLTLLSELGEGTVVTIELPRG